MQFVKIIYLFLFFLFLVIVPGGVYGAALLPQNIRNDAASIKGDFLQNYPLTINSPILRFSIDGEVSLLGQNSLFRVILIDNQQKEHLVYEAYPMIDDEGFITFSDVCRETCFLNSIVPTAFRVEGHKASFTIKKIAYSDRLYNLGLRAMVFGINREREIIHKEQELLKVQKLKTRIKEEKLKWTAGETTVSKMTYAEKKKLFSRPDGKPIDMLPNLQGFEYYKGGIFEIESDEKMSENVQGVSALRSSYDWRSVHGENWTTSVKNQGPYGTCWAHGNMATLEGVINVYYNQHLNLDLSEQYLISCDSSGGSVDEACFPYQGDPISCSNKCSNWNSRFWKASEWHQVIPTSFDDLKRMVVQKGPVYLHYNPWQHALVIVGFGKDPSSGQEYVVIKNSWGTGWGDGGFGEFDVGATFISGNGFYTHEIPIISSTQAASTTSIRCVDNDSDNYCNWGISPNKPASCPAICKAEKDCDDSNAQLGLYDANLNCRTCGIGDPTNLQVTCNAATAQFTWQAGTNASFYSLRIDDLSDSFSCSSPSDSCPDSSNTWYDYPFQSGHTYRWWMHSRGPCDGSWGNAVSGPNFTCPPITPTPISFTFSIRLRGISTAGATKMLEILFHSPSVDQSYMTVATSQANGGFTVPSLSLTGLSPGAYTVYIRDKTDGDYVANHLRKRMGDVSLISGANSAPASWATDISYFLKPGDVNGDNDVNVYDIGAILSIYTQATIPVTPSNRKYDIDSNNQIDVYDIAFMLVTYTNYTNPGD